MPDSENNYQVLVNDTGDTETSWTDSNVTSGTKYLYRVQALGNDGKEGSMSLPAQVVIPE